MTFGSIRRLCFGLLLAPALTASAACSSSQIGVGDGQGSSGSLDGAAADSSVGSGDAVPPSSDDAQSTVDAGNGGSSDSDGSAVTDDAQHDASDSGDSSLCPRVPSMYVYTVPSTYTCADLTTNYADNVPRAQGCGCSADCSVVIQDKLTCGCSVYVNPGRSAYRVVLALQAEWEARVKAGNCKPPECPLTPRCKPVPITPSTGECPSGACRGGGPL